MHGLVLLAVALLALCACGGGPAGSRSGDAPPLVIGGIPDQDVALLDMRFGLLADYLSETLGQPVRYQAATNYAAVVTGFANGDIHLAWFGGLTGVQARLETPGAEAVVQRPMDARFRSVFIARPTVQAEDLQGLAGASFTFGSESSTSGHLMPRHFLRQAGVDPDSDFAGPPGYATSHDVTWKLVEAGSFQAGVLNASVWDRAVRNGEVDASMVHEVLRTPTYFDYHWVAHPDLDRRHGDGTRDRVVAALLSMHPSDPRAAPILELFEGSTFIATDDRNYRDIEQVARSLGVIED